MSRKLQGLSYCNRFGSHSKARKATVSILSYDLLLNKEISRHPKYVHMYLLVESLEVERRDGCFLWRIPKNKEKLQVETEFEKLVSKYII